MKNIILILLLALSFYSAIATPPTITSVTSTTPNGPYTVGNQITITIAFSEAVFVRGQPKLWLETGTNVNAALYASGSGTTILNFIYTVKRNDISSDLDYNTITALELNRGSIKNAANENAVLSLPAIGSANSISGSKAIIIDAVPPTVTSVAGTTGTYENGQSFNIQVTFSEVVNIPIGGVPRIRLATSALDHYGTYTGGTGSNVLTFSYTVVSGDNARDLNYYNTRALELNGTTIKDDIGNNAVLTLPSLTSLSSLASNSTIKVDGDAPTIRYVWSSTPNGSYNAGDVINVMVTFSETVAVSGIPYITLETGADEDATYTSGSGTNTLTFRFTVQALDESTDLDYVGTGSLALSGGSISDAAGNDADLTLAAPGALGSLAYNEALILDNTSAIISGVSADNSGNPYIIGEILYIDVDFDEPVVVSGTPKLELETGTTNQLASYSSGSGTSTLQFKYTVKSGDVTSPLDYVGTSSLTLNSGAIKDKAGNDATLTLPALGELAASAVDIAGETATVMRVSSTAANGSYRTGSIPIYVRFSESVTVTGSPKLLLETGTADQYATYNPITSNTYTVVFDYAVTTGDNSDDLNYARTNSLILNGGTIKDASGNNTVLTLPATNSSYSLAAYKDIVIDVVEPTVRYVWSTTSNGYYNSSSSVNVMVTFSEPVVVSGIPVIVLETGTSDENVTYTSGSGTNTLSFNFTVQSSDATLDLDYKATNSLSGTITDAAGNTADLDLPIPGTYGSLGYNKAIVLDNEASTVSSVTSANSTDTYIIGEIIYINVIFNEPVVVNGTPKLELETGTTNQFATFTSGSGTNTLRFKYTVREGDEVTGDLDYVGTTSLTLNGGIIEDRAGNTATLTLPLPLLDGLTAGTISVDGVRPTITSVAGTDATVTSGTVDIVITFSENVTLGAGAGTPALMLETGDVNRSATYLSTSLTDLTFQYTIVSGDYAPDLNYLNTRALNLAGRTLTDAAGNTAIITLPALTSVNSLASNNDILVDALLPTITNVSSSSVNDYYNTGSSITILVTFSETVEVTGAPPTLTLETGSTNETATYASGSGSKILTFTYTILANDISPDLDYAATTSLVGTIKDHAGNSATLTLPAIGARGSLSYNKALIVDGVVATVNNVNSSIPDGTYDTGAQIYIEVEFSESVFVIGSPQITLNTAPSHVASYYNGSGSNTLVFKYVVLNGDASSDLDYFATNSLSLNGGTIKDIADNNAVLTFAVPGAANSLGFNKNIVINGASAKSLVKSKRNNNDNFAVNIYPIPSNGNFSIEMAGFNDANKTITIFDNLGRIVYSQNSNIDIENLSLKIPSGIYSLVILSTTQKVNKRIVIQ